MIEIKSGFTGMYVDIRIKKLDTTIELGLFAQDELIKFIKEASDEDREDA